MDVRTSPGLQRVGCDTLYLLQCAVGITEGDYFTGQFIDEISELTVRAECEVARAGIGSDIGRFTGQVGDVAFGA